MMSTIVEDGAPRAKWEILINRRLSQEDWHLPSSFAFRFTSNVALRENRFKILHQWYLTPARLSKTFSGTPNTCWWCDSLHAGFTHIWWVCQVIRPFWHSVHLSVQRILGFRVPYTPANFLLHDFQIWPKGALYVTLMTYLLCVVSLLIATAWKQPDDSSLSQWKTFCHDEV